MLIVKEIAKSAPYDSKNQNINVNVHKKMIIMIVTLFLETPLLKAKRKMKSTKLFSWGGYNGGRNIMIYDAIRNTKTTIKIDNNIPDHCDGIVLGN